MANPWKEKADMLSKPQNIKRCSKHDFVNYLMIISTSEYTHGVPDQLSPPNPQLVLSAVHLCILIHDDFPDMMQERRLEVNSTLLVIKTRCPADRVFWTGIAFARADSLDTVMDGLEEMWPGEFEEQDDEDDELDLDDDQGVDLGSPVMQDLSRDLHPPNGSLQADITFLFLTGVVASRNARCLVGFTNRGSEDFVINSIEGSFHYPQDYGFHLQNLSILPLNSVVHPQHEASFSYSFLVAGALGGRQLSLVITLSYHH
uniref:translocon-associated protein subunit alpha-like n=1 Tax=Myxine glutinosa TaxID=7769 RepID=UPI00358F823F